MSNFKKNKYRYRIIIAIGFVLLILVLRYMGVGNYISLEAIKEHKDDLVQFVSQHYVYAVVLYLFIFTMASFLSIPVTIILNVVAGFLFGALPGGLYVNIGTTAGSTLSFLTFRYLLGDVVRQRYKEKLKKFDAHIKENGASYLLSLQLFPATPTFLINTLSGLTSVTLWTFMWTTSLGILPGSLAYTFAGQQLTVIESARDILSWNIIIAFIVLGLVSLVPILVSRFFNKK